MALDFQHDANVVMTCSPTAEDVVYRPRGEKQRTIKAVIQRNPDMLPKDAPLDDADLLPFHQPIAFPVVDAEPSQLHFLSSRPAAGLMGRQGKICKGRLVKYNTARQLFLPGKWRGLCDCS